MKWRPIITVGLICAAVAGMARREHLDRPYPGGESWRQAVKRVGRFLSDLPLRWDRQRILVIGHVATRWGLDHFLGGVPLEDLIDQDFAWKDGSTGSASHHGRNHLRGLRRITGQRSSGSLLTLERFRGTREGSA
jgi:broad specificity phosphatase PhoE